MENQNQKTTHDVVTTDEVHPIPKRLPDWITRYLAPVLIGLSTFLGSTYLSNQREQAMQNAEIAVLQSEMTTVKNEQLAQLKDDAEISVLKGEVTIIKNQQIDQTKGFADLKARVIAYEKAMADQHARDISATLVWERKMMAVVFDSHKMKDPDKAIVERK